MMSDGSNTWSAVVPPKILSPAHGTSGLAARLTLTLETSAFQAANETHVSTDWEIWDVNTGKLVWSNPNDSLNKTLKLVPMLLLGGGRKLSIRVRHKTATRASEWSDPVIVQT